MRSGGDKLSKLQNRRDKVNQEILDERTKLEDAQNNFGNASTERDYARRELETAKGQARGEVERERQLRDGKEQFDRRIQEFERQYGTEANALQRLLDRARFIDFRETNDIATLIEKFRIEAFTEVSNNYLKLAEYFGAARIAWIRANSWNPSVRPVPYDPFRYMQPVNLPRRQSDELYASWRDQQGRVGDMRGQLNEMKGDPYHDSKLREGAEARRKTAAEESEAAKKFRAAADRSETVKSAFEAQREKFRGAQEKVAKIEADIRSAQEGLRRKDEATRRAAELKREKEMKEGRKDTGSETHRGN